MSDPIEKTHAQFWQQISENELSDIAELIRSERKTREARIEQAFLDGTSTDFTGNDQLLFDRMWHGDDLAAVNDELIVDFLRDLESAKSNKKDPTVLPAYHLYHLTRNTRLISFYYCFGSRSTIHPGRFSANAEQELLALLWSRTKEKNDIAMTRKSTWWIAGSENHDLNTKVTNLLTSAIFAEEPAMLPGCTQIMDTGVRQDT